MHGFPYVDALKRYRIVIALDGSEYSSIVLEHGLDQAARHDAPDLHILTVIDPDTNVQPIKDWLATQVLEGLDSFRAGRPDWRTRLHVRTGKAIQEIVNLAGEVKADLLVVGRYGLHHPRHSLAEQVVAKAPCATLVIGLEGQEVDTVPTCTACATAREESDGERWFCAEHSAPDRLRLSTLVPSPNFQTHGGPLW